MNGLRFRKALTDRKFVYSEDTDSWKGPNGCTISDHWIFHADDFHTSNVLGKALQAIDEGAKHVCAIITNNRPIKVEVYCK